MIRIQSRLGFTMLELLVVIAVIGILIGMLLPVTRSVREAARRTQCMNNLRQIGLATLNYESSYMEFPSAIGIESLAGVGNSDQYSGFVALLPFIEQGDHYERITKGQTIEGVDDPACPPLYGSGTAVWEIPMPVFACPSVAVAEGGVAPIDFGFCIGDRARNIASPKSLRGFFVTSEPITFDDITDGSSNTILAGEIGSRKEDGQENDYAVNQPASILDDPSSCFGLTKGKLTDWQFVKGVQLSPIGRGGHWADGRAGVALFSTILPPNSSSAAVNGSAGVDGIYSASGPHLGTINVVLGDGSTHSMNKEIDAGDSSSPTPTEEEIAARNPSPYGAWGRLGVINDGMVVNATDF